MAPIPAKSDLVSSMLIIFLLIIALGSCAVNPATGERQLVLMGEQQEIAMGKSYDQQVSAQLGMYPDDNWQKYVQQLGSDLAAKTERPNLPWQFRVVDDPTVNAFALPGGYIYVTRGILAHFNSEAELATVVGHEIGHVTARHSVEQISRAQLAQIGVGVAAIVSEDFRRYAGLAQVGLQVLFLKFSRDDERQADDLGLRYMTWGGYDPGAAPEVFEMLGRQSELHGGQRIPQWQSTHPDPANRAERLREQIASLPPDSRTGTLGRAEYLQRLNGLVFGDNPLEGYTVGDTFYHPDMRFQMKFPGGWKIINQKQAVFGLSPDKDAVVTLTLSPAATLEESVQKFFAQEGVERGQEWRRWYYHFRTTPQVNPSTGRQEYIQGIVGFTVHQDRVFSLLAYSMPERWPQVEDLAGPSITSFRQLSDQRYIDVQPSRIEIVKAPRTMTLAEFNGKYPSSVEIEALEVLNGIDAGTRLPAGTLVKRVTGGKLPTR